MGGEDTLQQREMQRQSTLLGMEMGEMTGARSATQQAYANQMAASSAAVGAQAAQASAWMNMSGSLASTAGRMYSPDGGGGGGSLRLGAPGEGEYGYGGGVKNLVQEPVKHDRWGNPIP
jgi:NACalpha-BTF3-like transcription factor